MERIDYGLTKQKESIWDILNNLRANTIAYAIFLLLMYSIMSSYVNGMAYKAEMYAPIIQAADDCRQSVMANREAMVYPMCDKTIGSFVLVSYNKTSIINSNYSIDRVI